MALPRGEKISDQTFADDTALYLQGTRDNMDKDWEWSREVGLQWIPTGKGVRYLGIQVGFHLPPEANFDKMLYALKGKLINWNTCRFSLARRILVANQVLLASMWYLAVA